MEKLKALSKLLSPEENSILEDLVSNFPEIKMEDKWEDCAFLPAFNVMSAKHAYDNWNLEEGDVLIVTYPKTGTNWTLEIVRRLLYQDEVMLNLSGDVPFQLLLLEFGPTEKFSISDKLPFPRRVFFTHLPAYLMNIDKIMKAKAKIVYVIRNPKDQMVSWSKFLAGFPPGQKEPLKSMVRQGWDTYFQHAVEGEIPVCMKPGEWYPEHILSWYKYRNHKNVYFICYEEMKKDFSNQARLLASFLEIKVTDEKIKEITEKCSFDYMKKDRTAGETLRSKLSKNIFHKGVVGGWKDYFTVSQSERVDAIMEEKLKGIDIKFIYEL